MENQSLLLLLYGFAIGVGRYRIIYRRILKRGLRLVCSHEHIPRIWKSEIFVNIFAAVLKLNSNFGTMIHHKGIRYMSRIAHTQNSIISNASKQLLRIGECVCICVALPGKKCGNLNFSEKFFWANNNRSREMSHDKLACVILIWFQKYIQPIEWIDVVYVN